MGSIVCRRRGYANMVVPQIIPEHSIDNYYFENRERERERRERLCS